MMLRIASTEPSTSPGENRQDIVTHVTQDDRQVAHPIIVFGPLSVYYSLMTVTDIGYISFHCQSISFIDQDVKCISKYDKKFTYPAFIVLTY